MGAAVELERRVSSFVWQVTICNLPGSKNCGNSLLDVKDMIVFGTLLDSKQVHGGEE